jgi:hypothetical protein
MIPAQAADGLLFLIKDAMPMAVPIQLNKNPKTGYRLHFLSSKPPLAILQDEIPAS